MKSALAAVGAVALLAAGVAAANGGDQIGGAPFVQFGRWTAGDDTHTYSAAHEQFWLMRLERGDRVTIEWREGARVKLAAVVYPGGTSDNYDGPLPGPIAISRPPAGKGATFSFTAGKRAVFPIAFLSTEPYESLRRPGRYRFLVHVRHRAH